MFNWKWRGECPPVVIWQGEKYRLVSGGQSTVFVETASRDRMGAIRWSDDSIALHITQGQLQRDSDGPAFLPELLEDALRLAKEKDALEGPKG